MSRRTRLWTGASLIVFVLGTFVAAQSPSPQSPADSPPQSPPAADAPEQRPPMFRGTSNFVVVDVYPRRNGTVVAGLTKADFQVTEDGKAQTIETFEFIASEPNTPDAERRDPISQQDGDRQAADPRNRVFVVYLDPYHTDVVGSRDARRPILDFLTRTINDHDVFGVLTPEVAVGNLVFARRTETLEAELTKYWTWGEADRINQMPRTPTEQQLDMCTRLDAQALGPALVRLHRENLLIESLENLMIRLRDLKDERKNVLFVSQGWIPRGPAEELKRFVRGGPPLPMTGQGTSGRIGIGPQPGLYDASFCDRQIARLASIDFEGRFHDLLERAVRANVTFYPVDVAGLTTSTASINVKNTLRRLSDATDGVAVIGTNDVTTALRRIAEGMAGFYLVGYYSTNPNNDGRYREIRVKTGQPRIDISARRGYLAPTAAMAAAATAPRAAALVVPAAIEAELNRLSRLRPDAELFSYGIAASRGLDVIVELSSRQTEGGRWTAGAEVRVALAQAAGSGEVVATGKIEPGSRSALVRVPLDNNSSGPWRVALRVSGSGGLLEDRIEIVAARSSLLGPPVGYRANVSPRAALKPIADFQLRRTERLHVEWGVLKAIDRKDARVLDRRGQPLPQPAVVSTVETGGDARIAADLAMAAFSEGDYILELTASAGAETERKVLAFRVVR